MPDKDEKKSDDVWIGFDLGGTKMLACAFDDDLKPLERERKKTKGNEGEDSVLKRIIESINKCVSKSGKSIKDVRGIGIGVPGTLDLQTGTIIEAPNLDWQDVPLRKILESEFKTKVQICNDVDAGVYGEYKFGAGQGAEIAVGISPGTGVGGGCVYHDEIFQGKRRSCMEVGHIPIISGAFADGAGHRGTVEAVASRLAIAAQAGLAAYRGTAPALNKKAGTDISEIRSGALADSVEQGDRVVKEIIETAIEHLSLGIVTLIHLMSPDVVILGGGLVEAMPNLFVDKTSKVVKNRILSAYRDTYKIKAAKLGDDASVMGSVAWAKRMLSK